MKADIPVYDIQNFTTYKTDGILVSKFGYYSAQHEHLQDPRSIVFTYLVFLKSELTDEDLKIFWWTKHIYLWFWSGYGWIAIGEPDGYLINFTTSYFNQFLANQE